MNFENMPLETVVFVVIVCMLTLAFQYKYDEKAVTYGPTILTTTGIFATFLGIALGLADFNATNIQDSVPRLLDGLKTAFWASVVGVGGALTLKIRHYFLERRMQTIAAPEPTAKLQQRTSPSCSKESNKHWLETMKQLWFHS